ncbi:MAG: ATP-binding protein [Bacteroidales bacterium]|nr:ATP-binding protein [Bacteroidales bacterium]
MERRRYPVDTQTFSKIVEGNYVYVDKTALIYKMVKDFNYVFLSRPRRFGKSLLCSTLKEYFEGNKEMFNGLQMAELEKDWVKYPVIHLDFSDDKSNNIKDIRTTISESLSEYETALGIENKIGGFNSRFSKIIKTANQKYGQKVVVILDEYDATMLNAIDDDKLQNQIRTMMTNLFSPLKKLDSYLRFVFITGITKFSQMSIFSALNNLQDISLMPEFDAICGISKDELFTQLKDGLQNFAAKNDMTVEEATEQFTKKYDGYHFSVEKQDIFNPFSVIRALNDRTLNDYWFGSATPTALIKLIRKFDIEMFDYESVECESSRFNQPVESVTDLVPFLFQTGYLTIKDYNKDYNTYILGYPNEEVKSSMANVLYKYTYKTQKNIPLKKAFIDFSKDDDLDKFIEHLKVFFYGFPFSMDNEKANELHYHSILYTALASFGADITANQETALGKADLVLKMPKTIYVIELKYNRSANAAMRQIEQREYAKAHLDSGKRIVKLAINFSSKERNIESYEAKEEFINN